MTQQDGGNMEWRLTESGGLACLMGDLQIISFKRRSSFIAPFVSENDLLTQTQKGLKGLCSGKSSRLSRHKGGTPWETPVKYKYCMKTLSTVFCKGRSAMAEGHGVFFFLNTFIIQKGNKYTKS